MSDAVKEVFGRPVTGDFTESYEPPRDQLPDAEFIERLDKLFETPEIKDVAWMQYTPYFNDGEPCVFSLHETYFGLNVTEGEFTELESMSDYGDGRVNSWTLGYEKYQDRLPFDAETRTRISDAITMFGGLGGFEVFLQKTFGDHAKVVATREGFDVEFYEHD